MFKRAGEIVPTEYFLKPGYIFVSDRPAVISTVLGSCVAVCLFDRKQKVGGINHFQLPTRDGANESTPRYGDAATLKLIRMMVNSGSKIKNLEAQIFGGAHNPKISQKNVGRENIRIAKKILLKYSIRIVSEDIGGEKGRKIVFNTRTNEIAILKVDYLRRGDWHPYENER